MIKCKHKIQLEEAQVHSLFKWPLATSTTQCVVDGSPYTLKRK